MTIERLSIEGFRNIHGLRLHPSRRINLIWGANAAGKTSFLEALDCLGRGRSFRSHLARQLVRRGEEAFVLSARILDEGPGAVDLGMERSTRGWRLRVKGEKVESLREFARLLPTQVLHPESHELVHGPSQLRREYIDWGVFHVEQAYGALWQRYHRVVKQRNRALRTGMSESVIRAWDPQLAELAERLHVSRERYLRHLDPHVYAYAARLMGERAGATLSLELKSGWNRHGPLGTGLAQTLATDRERGFTSLGAHRANMLVRYQGGAAGETASRGEQKLIVGVLRLAQLACLKAQTGRPGILLVDDVGAELDEENFLRLLEGIHELGAQAFLTATTHLELPGSCATDSKVFHVKHGQISEVL